MNKDIIQARRIYIDANIIIYFIEGWAGAQENIARFFSYVDEHNLRLVTSEITVAECLYGVYRAGRTELVERYKEIFDDIGAFDLVPVELGICEHAAKIGGAGNLKLIDAIHVTSAIEVGCDVFVTNDRGIKAMPTLKVVQLSSL